MALRVTSAREVGVAATLHPHYAPRARDLPRRRSRSSSWSSPAGPTAARAATRCADADLACALVQQPNFLGCIEDLRRLGRRGARRGGACSSWRCRRGALARAAARARRAAAPTSRAARPRASACRWASAARTSASSTARAAHVRQMPGRLVGETRRRATAARLRAHALHARAAHPPRARDLEHLHEPGPLPADGDDLPGAARDARARGAWRERNLAKAEYAKARVRATRSLALPLAAPTFNEFVVGAARSPRRAPSSARATPASSPASTSRRYAPELGPRSSSASPSARRARHIDRLVAALGRARRVSETDAAQALARYARPRLEEPLLFERSRPGRCGVALPRSTCPRWTRDALPAASSRGASRTVSPSSPRSTWCATSRASPPGTPRWTSASTRSAPAR